MERVCIVSKPQQEELRRILPELIEWLKQHGFEVLLDNVSGTYLDAAQHSTQVVARAELPAFHPRLVIMLGGDGTLLSVARTFAATGTAILSVNLGQLGFLTEVRLANLYPTLEGWLAGEHLIDLRAMLHASLWRDGERIKSFEALNDVVLSKGSIARMGEYVVELDGRTAASFRADGVIVATPTGSTAYTLSANGPILTPDVDAMVITPICPHLLTLRPIVVRGNASITLRVAGVPDQTVLTVDGQRAVELKLGDEVRCCRSHHSVKLIRMQESSFFDVLRSKLSWGER
jgi:NAD+ kinase